MAKTPNAPLGPASGKLGNIVYASWKGIAYARQYVIPANPQTAAQTSVPAAFARTVEMAQALLGGVLQPLWDPFVKKNSGYADFIGRTMKANPTAFDPTAVIVTRGNLEGAVIASADYSSDTVTVTWDGSTLSNGSATDKAVIFIYDLANKVGFVNAAVARSTETADVTIGTGRNQLFLAAYLGFCDSYTSPTKVANSDYSAVS